MKNIYLLPTEKASRIIKSQDNDFILLNTDAPNWLGINLKTTKQHIYITSDEEIKEDYVIAYGVVIKVMTFDEETLYFVNGTWVKRENCKKIILTTDPELINDGVQAIEDDFLEWFVKNPSCEEVGVVDDTLTVKEMSSLPLGTRNHKYKIIIPKEEPKQLAVEWLQEQLNKILIDNQIQQTLHLFEQAKQMEEEQRGYSEEHLIKVVNKFHSLQLNEFKSFLELLEFKKEEE